MNTPRFEQNYDHYLDQVEQQAQQQLQVQQDAEMVLEHVEAVRSGFRKAGVALHAVRVLKGQGQTGGEVALGAYERQVHQVGRVGMAELDHLVATEGQAPLDERVKDVLKHEVKGHREAHRKALQRGVAGQIAAVFGEDTARALDETHAMQQEKGALASSGRPSQYRQYEGETTRLSEHLKISRHQILLLFSEGREDAIVNAGLEQLSEAA